jgi:hypothetical protein
LSARARTDIIVILDKRVFLLLHDKGGAKKNQQARDINLKKEQ